MNNNATATDSAGDLGGGGGIINLNVSQALGVANSGILTVSLSQVNDNSAAGTGGRILEDGTTPGGPLTLRLSQVTGNPVLRAVAFSPEPAAR